MIYFYAFFPPIQIYCFPLDERAAVCDFETNIDGIITKGIVQEKKAARETFNSAVQRGAGAQLLEQRRNDVFEMHVGNILPRQMVTIKLTYVCETKIDVGGEVRFLLPANVAPRYSPPSVSGILVNISDVHK